MKTKLSLQERIELKNQIREVVKLLNLEKSVDKLLDSGMISIEKTGEGPNYRAAKSIVIVVFENAVEGLKPFNAELSPTKREIYELKKLLN